MPELSMEAFLWMFLPLFVAAGSALLAFYIMQARLEVALAKERESIADVRAALANHQEVVEEKVRSAEVSTWRQALNVLLADFRVDDRHYIR